MRKKVNLEKRKCHSESKDIPLVHFLYKEDIGEEVNRAPPKVISGNQIIKVVTDGKEEALYLRLQKDVSIPPERENNTIVGLFHFEKNKLKR